MKNDTYLTTCPECGNPETPIDKAVCVLCERRAQNPVRRRDWSDDGYDAYRDNRLMRGW